MSSLTVHSLMSPAVCRGDFQWLDGLDYLRLLVLSPILEEYVIRRGLQHALINHTHVGGQRAVWVSALVFSLLHIAQGAQTMLAVFLPGLLLSWLYQVKRNFYLCALVLSLLNATMLAVCVP